MSKTVKYSFIYFIYNKFSRNSLKYTHIYMHILKKNSYGEDAGYRGMHLLSLRLSSRFSLCPVKFEMLPKSQKSHLLSLVLRSSANH